MTEAVKAAIKERIKDCTDEVMASFDEKYDTFLKGMTRAFNEVLELKYADISTEETDEIFTRDVSESSDS